MGRSHGGRRVGKGPEKKSTRTNSRNAPWNWHQLEQGPLTTRRLKEVKDDTRRRRTSYTCLLDWSGWVGGVGLFLDSQANRQDDETTGLQLESRVTLNFPLGPFFGAHRNFLRKSSDPLNKCSTPAWRARAEALTHAFRGGRAGKAMRRQIRMSLGTALGGAIKGPAAHSGFAGCILQGFVSATLTWPFPQNLMATARSGQRYLPTSQRCLGCRPWS